MANMPNYRIFNILIIKIMDAFIELSIRHCSGIAKLLPDEEIFMRNFIMDPARATQILKEARTNYQVMVCFNAITR